MPPKGFGTAVIGDIESEDDYLNGSTYLDMGFTQEDSSNKKISKYDIYKDQYNKGKQRNETNMWDIANFTSVDNKLPIYPRRRGYVDFDGMTVRPNMNGKYQGAHETRFLSTNLFPSPKHSPKVYIEKQLPRDDRVLYYGINMSDSLYNPVDQNKIRPGPKGTLQFA